MQYFGYGSNLNRADWEAWCARRGYSCAGGLVPRARAWLLDHRPVYHYRSEHRGGGALDVVPALGVATPGLIFELSDAAQIAMDDKEGVPDDYQRVAAWASDAAGRLHAVTTYRVTAARTLAEPVAPAPSYAELVAEGLAAAALEPTPTAAAARGERVVGYPEALFVYGTLRAGGALAGRLAPFAVERRAASVPGALVDLGAYPGWREGASDERVVGEWVRLTRVPEALRLLDELEGFAGFGHPESEYHRVVVECAVDGAVRLAWAYRLAGDASGRAPVPGGDWLAHAHRGAGRAGAGHGAAGAGGSSPAR